MRCSGRGRRQLRSLLLRLLLDQPAIVGSADGADHAFASGVRSALTPCRRDLPARCGGRRRRRRRARARAPPSSRRCVPSSSLATARGAAIARERRQAVLIGSRYHSCTCAAARQAGWSSRAAVDAAVRRRRRRHPAAAAAPIAAAPAARPLPLPPRATHPHPPALAARRPPPPPPCTRPPHPHTPTPHPPRRHAGCTPPSRRPRRRTACRRRGRAAPRAGGAHRCLRALAALTALTTEEFEHGGRLFQACDDDANIRRRLPEASGKGAKTKLALPAGPVTAALARRFHVAAYSALIEYIVATQKDPIKVANVLFKWQALWENVVDTTRHWDLRAETSWQQAREADQLTLHARAKARAPAASSKYLASQALAGSSARTST